MGSGSVSVLCIKTVRGRKKGDLRHPADGRTRKLGSLDKGGSRTIPRKGHPSGFQFREGMEPE